MEESGISTDGLLLSPPLGYLDFLRLISQARLVLTDSGGIQEETTILGVPCLTLRENTERPVTTEVGTNRLVGVNPEDALRVAQHVLATPPLAGSIPELWDGHASERILDVIEKRMG
jgi:UDP-N-acetylglucosamine 2-epimerase (non-hydrolysing)